MPRTAILQRITLKNLKQLYYFFVSQYYSALLNSNISVITVHATLNKIYTLQIGILEYLIYVYCSKNTPAKNFKCPQNRTFHIWPKEVDPCKVHLKSLHLKYVLQIFPHPWIFADVHFYTGTERTNPPLQHSAISSHMQYIHEHKNVNCSLLPNPLINQCDLSAL